MYQLAMTGYRQISVDVTLYQAMGERYENGSSAYHGVLMLEYIIEQYTE
jgi:transposase